MRTAAHYCANTPILLGVMVLGTLNHFAKESELPLNAEELIDSVKNQKTITIDLAEVNGLVFVNNSSIGFYPRFAKKRDFYCRKYTKWLSYFPSFFESLRQHPAFTLTIKSESLNVTVRTSFLMVSNNRYSYEFPMTFKRESFKEALLGLYFFKYGKLRILKILKMMLNNKSNFEISQSKQPIEIKVADVEQINISLDGDAVTVNTPLYYKSLPQSLTLFAKL